ncbi:MULTISPECIES: Pr6Pr family membrane protein [Bacillus cereus group]|uniref:Pr6Pr family membrane protein n=3 Tax=Bacillus cereus group TaxID=86661 RepID=A0A1C4DWU6_BACTU|nr:MULTISPECIES: Pr6Pr family membrane protein [Bacillus cereus group]KZD29398.1 hypothetical protein B4082_4505 [Bacillus cereus]MBX0352942.1 Pr6Pr family membrane protein [Bacillus toyonensis]MBZ4222086.1 Pr6Pr family membrane protein [Bacillus wiedmannii]MCU5577971.1 Pr6Pr family membrane protein [Bacillus wiedmannii]MDI6676147.1 Pr6Pr family membrane protein [Bacillus wiedmannii]
MIRNRVIAVLFRIGSLIFALYGLLSRMGIQSGEMNFKIFMYYTIQSNFLALILFSILTIRTVKGLINDGKTGSAGYFPRFEMICVIDLLLTLIVYWVLLAPTTFTMGGSFYLWKFDNLAVHLITPILCLVDYFLFTESNHLKYRDVYYVLIYPLSYVAFATIAGLMGYVYNISPIDGKPVHYAYFFFDYDRIGAKSLVYIGGLIVFFLVLSHIMYLFDKKVYKPLVVSK